MTKSIGIALLFVGCVLAASPVGAENSPKFIANRGQFPEQVQFKLQVANAGVFFENNRIVFNFYDPERLHSHGRTEVHHAEYIGHAYSVLFEHSDPETKVRPDGVTYPDRINYIRNGHTVSGVPSFTEIVYEELYEGIDLVYYGHEGDLKYDVLVAPGADPSQLQMRYEGMDRIDLRKGKLLVSNTFNTVMEFIPLAYQEQNGVRQRVLCEYVLNGTTVGFHFPEGYDDELPLVIDPTLVFSSYSGSTANNFGFTATYDENGALYGGGIVFDLGYPTVTGAYSEVFSGVIDMAISKFAPDGSYLEYSTYIGGSSADVPHSMIVNSQGQLVILGSTSSLDYPTTATAFDTDFNGGTSVNYASNGTNFQNGSDMVVTVLSADGSFLIGSTYLGGSLNDGLNADPTLSYNYGDIFRGEVIVDPQDRIYVASSTVSPDLPVTSGAIDQTLGGTQDACVAKFNADVSVLEWCTYVGGSGSDAGYSMKLNSTGDLYLAGGTTSTDLTVDAGALYNVYQGGAADGFLYRLSGNGNTLINATYIGTGSYDQTYFVEVDDDDDVYTYGQSTGSYPVSPGTYSNVNGKQFIQKLSPDLSGSSYSTVFGSGSSAVNISPTAFLVDICERVFVSGWGGGTNNGWNNATGNTMGLPTTTDGEQLTTDGSDFYFMVLEADATSLLYGSFFGGNGIQEHVDGGTSRFNDNGVIHQAVCAGCGGSDTFPTTPGVVSNVNGNSCNLGVIKLDLEISAVQVEIAGSGTEQGCAPFAVQFESELVNATHFLWYFGDGDTSSLPNPSHIYTDPGVYQVMLVGTDTAFCTGEAFSDTALITVTVSLLTDAAEAGNDAHLCPGDSVILGQPPTAGYSYQWTPTTGLSDPNAAQPVAMPEQDILYFLTITNPDNCQDTDSVLVTVFNTVAFPDTTVCAGDSVQVFVQGGTTFQWQPATGVSNPNVPDPYITAGFSETYTVISSDGLCQDSATIMLGSIASPIALFDVEVRQSCSGDSVRFVNLSENAEEFEWNIGSVQSNAFEPETLFQPGEGPLVILIASNNNGTCTDTLVVDYLNGWYTEDSVLVSYPNVITPDGDGINDCFHPKFKGDLQECFTLKVFSRWGRLLYDSEKHGGNCWDGTQRTGQLVAEGTYYFIANVRGMDHAGYLTVLYP